MPFCAAVVRARGLAMTRPPEEVGLAEVSEGTEEGFAFSDSAFSEESDCPFSEASDSAFFRGARNHVHGIIFVFSHIFFFVNNNAYRTSDFDNSSVFH